MKKFFIFAILIIVLGGLISCNQPNNVPDTTVYHFESIKLKKNVMEGDSQLKSLLPEKPVADTPFTISPSSLTEELYSKLWNAKEGNIINRSYTKAQFKTAYVPHNADDTLKAHMEYALNDLITKGKLSVVIYGLFTPNPGDPNTGVIKYYAVFNKR